MVYVWISVFYTVNHNILIEKLDLSWHLWCKQRLVHLLSYQKKSICFLGANQV